MHICICRCIRIRMYVCMCVYIYTHICISVSLSLSLYIYIYNMDVLAEALAHQRDHDFVRDEAVLGLRRVRYCSSSLTGQALARGTLRMSVIMLT